MKRTLIAAIAVMGMLAASSAGAASLSMSTDKSVYTEGENIILSMTGGTTGGSASAVFVDVAYSNSGIVNGLGAVATQSQQITSFGGGLSWAAANPACVAGGCTVMNQLAGLGVLAADSAIIIGTLTLPTTGTGILTLTAGGNTGPLDWFGQAAPAPVTVTIVPVPEPATAGMLGLGLLGLALAGRRRA